MPDTRLVDPPRKTDSKVPFTHPPPRNVNSPPPLVGAIARIYWMLIGNAALYLIALAILEDGHGHGWTADVLFWTVVASLVLVRYADIVWLRGATATGAPASIADWQRYVFGLLGLASIVWLLAHLVAVAGGL